MRVRATLRQREGARETWWGGRDGRGWGSGRRPGQRGCPRGGSALPPSVALGRRAGESRLLELRTRFDVARQFRYSLA